MKHVICIPALLSIKTVIIEKNKFLPYKIDNFVFLWNELTANLKIISKKDCPWNKKKKNHRQQIADLHL